MPDPGNNSDRDLLARFGAGDREAFTVIYRKYSPGVFRFSLHMSGDEVKAGEVVQDVFVWLIQHAGSFDPERGELGAFLLGVARKFLQRILKNERRWIPLEEAFLAPASGRGEASRQESRAAQLREAIARLPPKYREVVVLCDLEGNSYEAAGAALDCAVGTVRSRLHRARILLGRKLQSKKEMQQCEV